VYNEKLLMMDRGTVRNMCSFILKINEKLLHLVVFIIMISHRSFAVTYRSHLQGSRNPKSRSPLSSGDQLTLVLKTTLSYVLSHESFLLGFVDP